MIDMFQNHYGWIETRPCPDLGRLDEGFKTTTVGLRPRLQASRNSSGKSFKTTTVGLRPLPATAKMCNWRCFKTTTVGLRRFSSPKYP